MNKIKRIKLKLIGLILLIILTVTGCTEPNNDNGSYDFIKECNSTPGCKYKVLSNECVCDKGHDYIPGP